MKHLTKPRIEIFIIIVIFGVVLVIFSQVDLFETIHNFIINHESWELDEIIPAVMSLSVLLLIFSIRRLQDNKKAFKELEKQHKELKQANDEIKTLTGFIPVCSKCKKVKDSKGYWDSIESYIMKHTDALLTHGLCEDCIKELYGEEFLEDDEHGRQESKE